MHFQWIVELSKSIKDHTLTRMVSFDNQNVIYFSTEYQYGYPILPFAWKYYETETPHEATKIIHKLIDI